MCLLAHASFQIKRQDLFDEWVSKLRHHRIFRQNEIATYEKTFHYPHYQCPNSPSMSDTASIRKVETHSTKVPVWDMFLIRCAA